MKWIGELRDGLLVTATILYILGYIIWAINAWQWNLGLLPVLESQYFLAGIVPALSLAASYFAAIRGFPLLRKKVIIFLKPSETGWNRPLSAVFLYAALALMLITAYYTKFGSIIPIMGPSKSVLWLGLIDLLILFAILSIVLLPPHWKSTRWGTIFSPLLAILLFFEIMWLYIFYVYPLIPQEFGGPQARCAYLDIVKAQVSNETLEAITPTNATMADSQVVRSTPVGVFFSGNDFILVKPYVEEQEGSSSTYSIWGNAKTYEIRRSAVKAITWCGRSK
jgi:hypothetical protein